MLSRYAATRADAIRKGSLTNPVSCLSIDFCPRTIAETPLPLAVV